MVQLKNEVLDGTEITAGTKKLSSYGYIKYDNATFDFITPMKNIYLDAFSHEGKLEELHEVIEKPDFPPEGKQFYGKIQEFGQGDRDSIFIKKFHEAWDNDSSWENIYHQFIRQVVHPKMFPEEEELVVQKTPNIRLSIPGVSNIGRLASDPSPDIIGLHCDGEHGHPHQERNIIIPITKMTSTNSMMFEPYPASNLTYEDFEVLETDVDTFFHFYGNRCLHYNRVNDTGDTRISFDFRVIPYSRYDAECKSFSASTKSKFKIGDYYCKIVC